MSEIRNISTEEVQAALGQILASSGFANAGRLSRLLRHVVEKTLAGEADQLKEYAVGIEVFDRDDKYDPRVDSIVRVEAGRLRSRLDEYYAAGSASDAVRISLPRGAYVARFEHRSAAPAAVVAESPQRRRDWIRWPLRAGLIGVVVAMVVWLGGWRSPTGTPSVAVLAFAQYSASDEDGAVAARLTDSVTSELARLGTVSVVSHTSAMQFAGARKPLREIAQSLDADFVVEASIQNDVDGIRAMVRVVDAVTDRKMWVQEYEGRADDLQALSRNIASGVSTAVLGTLAPGTWAPTPRHQ